MSRGVPGSAEVGVMLSIFMRLLPMVGDREVVKYPSMIPRDCGTSLRWRVVFDRTYRQPLHPGVQASQGQSGQGS
jgi:hypothetical protein